jgi:hypothetical protein
VHQPVTLPAAEIPIEIGQDPRRAESREGGQALETRVAGVLRRAPRRIEALLLGVIPTFVSPAATSWDHLAICHFMYAKVCRARPAVSFDHLVGAEQN